MSIRWISEVPSKIVKILDYVAVSAGQRPADPRGISADSARPVRDECRFPSGPCPFSSVVPTHAEKALVRFRGCHRQPTPQQVHLRYILALTCQYLDDHDTRPRVRGADGPHTGRTSGGCPNPRGWPLSRRHGGVTGRTGRIAPMRQARRRGTRRRAPYGGCQSHFPNSPRLCLSMLSLTASTSCAPSGTCSAARCEPMNPAAPVISALSVSPPDRVKAGSPVAGGRPRAACLRAVGHVVHQRCPSCGDSPSAGIPLGMGNSAQTHFPGPAGAWYRPAPCAGRCG